EVLLALGKAASLSGKVLDRRGVGMTGVQVVALRRSYVGGLPRFVRLLAARTDDRGQYRVFGLRPGTYAVATLSSSTQRGRPGSRGESPAGGNAIAFAVSYYPDADSIAAAQLTELNFGDERGDLDFHPSFASGRTISGRVIGLPAGHTATVSVTPSNSVD